jgi:cytochrome c-type biogenesis protein CcmH/NrfG
MAAAHLFNRGLSAAQKGEAALARDLFAAVVYWCPMDLEARNGLASACFMLRDYSEAQRHWEMVLQRSPGDSMAQEGVALVAARSAAADVPRRSSQKQRRRGRRAR